MNAGNVQKLLALIVAIVIGLILGLRLWANHERNAMQQLEMVHVGPNGRVYTMLGNTLYINSSDGQERQVIPLQRLGIAGFWGDFVVLSDNSIVFPSAAEPPVDMQKRSNIMMSVAADAGSKNNGKPLIRCSLDSLKCRPLIGKPASDYFRAQRNFKLAVDETAKRIYVADTAEQRLLILDMTGRILARKVSGVQFPNALWVPKSGDLDVADSRNSRILRFDVTGDKFSTAGKPISTTDLKHARADYYPVGGTSDSRGYLWTLVADDGYENGRIFRFDPDGTHPRYFPLPDSSDVLFLAAGHNEIFAPDQVLYRIHALTLDGKQSPDFGEGRLAVNLKALAGKRRLYDLIFDNSLMALIAVLALLFIALRVQKIYQKTYSSSATNQGESIQELNQTGSTPQKSSDYIAWSGRAFEFRRRFMVLLTPGSRKLLIMIGVAVVILILGTFGYLDYLLAKSPHAMHKAHHESFHDSLDIIIMIVLSLVLVVYVWLSVHYERLYLSHNGIRYQTYLAGPFSWLAPLWPSWQATWGEIADVELMSNKAGRYASVWNYRLQMRNGVVRRVNALTWKLESKPDKATLTYVQLLRRDKQAIRNAITGTTLYRLLELSVKANQPAPAPAVKPAFSD